jgi:peptide methionine sulfoxide reductase MsrB
VNRLTHVIDAPTSKPNKAILKKTRHPIQYEVTQEQGTDPPFKNE